MVDVNERSLGEQIRRWHELDVISVGDPGNYLRGAHPEIRALMPQFPPACLVTSSPLRPAPCPEPGRLAIVTGWSFIGGTDIDWAVRVQVTDLYRHLCSIRPANAAELELGRCRPPAQVLVDPTLLCAIAFRAGWDPPALRACLH